MSGRLALLLWAARIVRRERRQHALVVGLVAFGVSFAVVAAGATARLAPPATAELAAARAMVTIWPTVDTPGVDRSMDLDTELRAIEAAAPGIEVVARSFVGPERIALIAQDPAGRLGAPWLDLRDGRWPGPGEITLSTRAFAAWRAVQGTPVAMGDVREIAGAARRVVGRYENPTRLDDATGLVPRAETGAWQRVDVLAPRADHPAVASLRALGLGDLREGPLSSEPPILGYVLGTVLCLQLGVLASSGFTVLVSRRRRQLGVLAAVGATPTQLGSVLTMTGVVVGVVGAVIGFVVGVAVSMLLTPALQSLADHRLGTFDLPWRFLLPTVPLGIVTAVAGAWWPARRLRATSVVDALADRRGRAAGWRRSLGIGLALLAGGGTAMKIGAPRNSATIILPAVGAVAVGGLLLAPGLTTLLGFIGSRAPLAVQVAWRDLARHRARSAGAVAAAAIALAVPFGVASFVASLSTTWLPDVPTNVASIRVGDQSTTAGTGPPADVRKVAAAVPDARLVPLVELVDETVTTEVDGREELAPIPFTVPTLRSNGDMWLRRTALATPDLVALMGLDPPAPDVDVLVLAEGAVQLDKSVTVEQRISSRRHLGFPEALVFGSVPGVGDETMRTRWYLVNDAPFTQDERDRLLAAGAAPAGGQFAEQVQFADDPPPFVAVRSIALAIGALFGLGVVAAAATLVRVEAANDRRVLWAIGASPRATRAINAATVVGLTVAAAGIAVGTAFVMLAGIYLNPDEAFEFTMPWAELAALFVALPLLGGACAWLVTSTRRASIGPRSLAP